MRKKRDEGGAIDEVDELLRAAQDDVLLKLSLNSHIARSSSGDIDPDLTRRFHALKSRPSAPAAPSQPPPRPTASASSASSSSSPSPRQVDDELKAVLGDDLSARFAALRGSLYSSSPSSSPDAAAAGAVGPSAAADGRDRRETGDFNSRGEHDRKEKDEVEKLIQWAVDAARLDPSPPSDDDDNNDSDDDNDDSDEECEQRKNKQKSK
ncbi:uncharacterized protein J3R85_016453 [Psidium guajava]|nr:uncharacterized protein J3R85_016453 [Psidium guajava]